MAGYPCKLPAPVPVGSAGLTRREVLALPRPSRGPPPSSRFTAVEPPKPREDAEAAGEYAADMLRQMLSREVHFTPKWGFMRFQPYITPEHRATLVDWFSDLRRKLGLRRETVFLTVNIVDRYLSLVEVRQSHLQLVGVAALLIAAKFEEIKPPDVKDLVYYTGHDTYTRQQVVKKELDILTRLRFEVASPTPLHFLVHLSAVGGAVQGRLGVAEEQPQDRRRAESRRDAAARLLEAALTHYPLAWHTPSHLGSAALLLGNEICGMPPWPENLARLTGHSREMLEPLADELHSIMVARDDPAALRP